MKTITFKLKDNINENADNLILYPPVGYHRELVSKLDSMLMNGFISISKEGLGESSTKLEKDSGEPIEQTDTKQDIFADFEPASLILFLKAVPSSDFSFYPLFCDVFRSLLLSDGICKMQKNNKSLPAGYLDKFSIRDFEELMGTYIKVFFSHLSF